MRPPSTCGAIGSALSARIVTFGGAAPGPNAIGRAPKPFGTIRATGASPRRTAASADAAVQATGAPAGLPFSAGIGRLHLEPALPPQALDEASRALAPVLVDDEDLDPARGGSARAGKDPGEDREERDRQDERQHESRAVAPEVQEPVLGDGQDRAHSRSSRPVSCRKTCSRVGLFSVRSRTATRWAWKDSRMLRISSAGFVTVRRTLSPSTRALRDSSSALSAAGIGAAASMTSAWPDAERPPHELVLGALRDDPSVVDDRDAVAEPLGLFHVVGGVEERHAPGLELSDHAVDALAGLRIHPDGRLVEQEHAGTVDRAGGDVEPPLHPAREPVGLLVGAIGQADPVRGSSRMAVWSAPPARPWYRPNVQRFSRGREQGIEGDLLGNPSPRGAGAVVGGGEPQDRDAGRRPARRGPRRRAPGSSCRRRSGRAGRAPRRPARSRETPSRARRSPKLFETSRIESAEGRSVTADTTGSSPGCSPPSRSNCPAFAAMRVALSCAAPSCHNPYLLGRPR